MKASDSASDLTRPCRELLGVQLGGMWIIEEYHITANAQSTFQTM